MGFLRGNDRCHLYGCGCIGISAIRTKVKLNPAILMPFSSQYDCTKHVYRLENALGSSLSVY